MALDTDRFNEAISIIRVTPENYKSLTPEVILHVYDQIDIARNQIRSTYERPGRTVP